MRLIERAVYGAVTSVALWVMKLEMSDISGVRCQRDWTDVVIDKRSNSESRNTLSVL